MQSDRDAGWMIDIVEAMRLGRVLARSKIRTKGGPQSASACDNTRRGTSLFPARCHEYSRIIIQKISFFAFSTPKQFTTRDSKPP